MPDLNTSITNISINEAEEVVEEIKSGDKTLCYYRKRSISTPTSLQSDDDLPPIRIDRELNLPIKTEFNLTVESIRDSKRRSPGNYREAAQRRSNENLADGPQLQKNKNRNSVLSSESELLKLTDDPIVTSESRLPFSNHRQSENNEYNRYTCRSDSFNSNYSQPIDSRLLRPTIVTNNNPSLNSSHRSDNSTASKRYLDLCAGERELDNHIIIENRNISLRRDSLPSVTAESSVSKYLTNRNSSIRDSEMEIPPGYTSHQDLTKNYPVVTPSQVKYIQQNPTIHVNNNNIAKNNPPHKNEDDYKDDFLSRRTQICRYVAIFLVVVAALVCLLFGTLHYYAGYYPQTVHLNEGDIKLISASSSFCSRVVAKSSSSKLRVIVFKKNSVMKTYENNVHGTVNVVPSTVWKTDFNLQTGTKVSIRIRTKNTLDILIFTSMKSYDTWFERKQSVTYIKKVPCCADTKEKEKTIMFKTLIDARYFIVLHNKIEVIPVTVEMDIKIDRLSYAFTDTSRQCSALPSDACSVEYTFNNGEDTVLEIPKYATTIPKSSEVEWRCEARVWFYVVLLLAIFILTALLITSIYFFIVRYFIHPQRYCCRNHDDDKAASSEFLYHNKNTDRSRHLSHNNNVKHSSNRTLNDSIIEQSNNRIRDMLLDTSMDSRPTSLYKAPLSPTVSTRSGYSKSSTYMLNHSKYNQSLDPDIATIYEQDNFIIDPADSGISVDPDFAPSREAYKNDMIRLQELQILRTRDQQTQRFLISDRPQPRVTRAERPVSTIYTTQDYTYDPRYASGRMARTWSVPREQVLGLNSTTSRDNLGYEHNNAVIASGRTNRNPFQRYSGSYRLNSAAPRRPSSVYLQSRRSRHGFAVNDMELDELDRERDSERFRKRVLTDSLDPEMYI